MEAIKQLQRKYGFAALLTAILLDVLLSLIGHTAAGHGILLGGVFSIFNFILLGNSLPRRLVANRKRATALALVSVYGRYVFLAIPLVMALKFTVFDFFATVCGLFLVQGCILVEQWLRP